jgi:hypothetical protein
MGFLANNEKAREVLFNEVKSMIENKIQNDEDYTLKNLDSDQKKVLEFFNIN